MAVFRKQDWRFEVVAEPEFHWILPIDIWAAMRIRIIAVYAHINGKSLEENYIGQVHKAIRQKPLRFEEHPVIMAGDFNSNRIWDSKRRANRSSVVDHLRLRGLESAYHKALQEEQGAETRSTYFEYRRYNRPFHIDYVFCPKNGFHRRLSRWASLITGRGSATIAHSLSISKTPYSINESHRLV